MEARDLPRSRASVSTFAERIFGHLPRTDQRYWAQAYLTGLLGTEGKKSVRRLAATISDSPTASQSMHQFVNASPWDWAPARAELMRWVGEHLVPRAWVLDVAVLRKRGEHSCGVHRRFVPATGRSVNCQVGVGAFIATESEAVPVDWRLLLPGTWLNDERSRTRARIPANITARAIEQNALDLVDALTAGTGLGDLPVVADLSAHAATTALVGGLTQRGRNFVVAVPGRMPVTPGGYLAARPEYGNELPAVVEAQRFFDPKQQSTRYDSTRPREEHSGQPSLVTGLVRLPEVRLNQQAPHRTYRMFAVRHPAGRRSTQLWLTNMVHRRVDELFALTQHRRRATLTLQNLERGFGLLDFEGRSYPGWHHHMTLVSAAYAYSRLEASAAEAVPESCSA